jgi:hypothetical protein
VLLLNFVHRLHLGWLDSEFGTVEDTPRVAEGVAKNLE